MYSLSDIQGKSRWLVSQLGAREHYAVPRALRGQDALAGLITDAWVEPGTVLAGTHRRLRERFHPGLASARVQRWTLGLLAFEALARARRLCGWPLILARNAWFQRRVTGWLRSLPVAEGSDPILFSYSYTACVPFRLARERGWRTVLGQIDPGPVETEIVQAEQEAFGHGRTNWSTPPPRYWDDWREECDLADRIIVNSRWSRDALVQAGIADAKITVVPLAYEVAVPDPAVREYPSHFDARRPLRVLFLGQINLRKGLARVMEAARMLAGEPVEFWMVGPLELNATPDAAAGPGMKWFGPVPRGEVARFYQAADVFLFPTLSDGFGLTQLEAQARGLPIIASSNCGEVVRDGVNGFLLSAVSDQTISNALLECLHNPGKLEAMSRMSSVAPHFSTVQVGKTLISVAAAAESAPRRK
jgi:glycosyltransferase involved in cell wall biosynthesis